MTTFVIHNGKPQAKGGCNDDEVMTWGVALQVNEIAPYEGLMVPVERREDGLIKDPYKKEDWAVIEEPSMEEKCLIQAVDNQSRVQVDDYIGSINEQIENMYD
jgi:hypothetical protein